MHVLPKHIPQVYQCLSTQNQAIVDTIVPVCVTSIDHSTNKDGSYTSSDNSFCSKVFISTIT